MNKKKEKKKKKQCKTINPKTREKERGKKKYYCLATGQKQVEFS